MIPNIVRKAGKAIIALLGEIEEVNKAVWEKKKFITETFYCITVGNIDERFYDEIAACEAQWQEWKELFHIHEQEAVLFAQNEGERKEARLAFLKKHPTLVLDTRHFDTDFTDRLLASFEDLDEETCGLLIHSENWQALNLLLEKHRERIKTIYIDPPYNTGNDEFIYRDQFRHSSWLTMMENRLRLAREWMREDGAIFVSVDDNEHSEAWKLMEMIFGSENAITSMVWEGGPKNDSRFISVSQDYIIAFVKNKTHLAEKGEVWRIRKGGGGLTKFTSKLNA